MAAAAGLRHRKRDLLAFAGAGLLPVPWMVCHNIQGFPLSPEAVAGLSGLAILGGALIGGVGALIAAFGFFTNRWTLANASSGSGKKQDQKPGKTQRILAVSLTLVFSVLAAASAGLAMFGL